MYKNEIVKEAAIQLAKDLACYPNDFLRITNTVVQSKNVAGRRNLTTMGTSTNDANEKDFFRAASFGYGTVVSVDKQMYNFAASLLKNMKGTRAFDAAGVYIINSELKKYGKAIEGFCEYYLPHIPQPNFAVFSQDNFPHQLNLYKERQISQLYHDDRFNHALLYSGNSERRDMLAVTAKKGDIVIGVAGCSNDSARFWQIGVDILPQFRQQGIGKALVAALTKETLYSGIIPYYGTWWSNIASRNLAISCGYYPAWVEMRAIDVN